MQISNKEYEQYRPLLFSIGYRMLGTVSDAEDLVHETFLRVYELDEQQVEHKKAYLCKMMTNRCLDFLKSARKTREQYIGPWVPEPISLEPIEPILEKEKLSIAYLRMMENLTPEERAVVLLREYFEFPYKEIAININRKEDHCRKLFSRAKQKLRHVDQESLNYDANKSLIDQFIAALQTQNKEHLIRLLSEKVTLYSDGGGKVLAALRPIQSQSHVMAFLTGILKRAEGDYYFEIKNVNGQPGIVNYMNGQIHSVVSFFISDDEIKEIYMTVNPDKLGSFIDKQCH